MMLLLIFLTQIWLQTSKSISHICVLSTRSSPDVEDLETFFASKFTLRRILIRFISFSQDPG